MEDQVKRLESFPNFKYLVKKNSIEKEILRLKTNLDLKIRLLFKENLPLFHLEGIGIDRVFEPKIRLLYYQGWKNKKNNDS